MLIWLIALKATTRGKPLSNPITELKADTHTDSGDMSPTRTCVPYVLLAIV